MYYNVYYNISDSDTDPDFDVNERKQMCYAADRNRGGLLLMSPPRFLVKLVFCQHIDLNRILLVSSAAYSVYVSFLCLQIQKHS